MAMIPFDWSDKTKLHTAIGTGILEVATGIFLLIPSLRKWAAFSSMGLLLLLTPAMYHILAHPDSVKSMGSMQTLFRVILLPNNIFLAICSLHLWRHPDASLSRPAPSPAPDREPLLAGSPVKLIVPALLLAANCAGFLALAAGAPGFFGVTSIWAMACISSGALIGFLFGVPRVNPKVQLTSRLIPNANVEAVSDWLTKILVGVGLVNFRSIGEFAARLGAQLAQAAGAQDPAFATGLIVYFFVIGIIQGYILTRMFLKAQFDEADSADVTIIAA
jgi:uncharacterized membrane protein